jgi:outer membrane lipoprotein-sorting protein
MKALALLLLVPSVAFAETGEELLKKADATANNCKDQRILITMTIEGNGQKKQARLETMEKGGTKRLIRFLAPGDVKGMQVLMDGEAMYVYLPQFQKVRRVASHAKQQGIMDSDFTNDDMGSLTFAQTYNAEILDQNDANYHLKLTPKPGAEVSVEALDMMIDKATTVITKIEYVVGGKTVRRQTRSNVKTLPGGFYRPMTITMEDLTKAHKTTMTLEDIKINTGLPDTLFTKQQLERAQ